MPHAPAEPDLRFRRRALAAARDAVTEAAEIVQTARRSRAGRATRRKGIGDFVTATDLRCERLLKRRLCAALPEAGFLGEETTPTGLDRDLVWIVDPIDGTSNFASGLPHFAVAAALLWRRRPLAAAMWCAPEGAMYTAIAGDGARRDGRRLPPPQARAGDAAILGCQWHRGQQDLGFVGSVQQVGARVRTFGCTVVQLADVASGRLDANVQAQGRLWDIAAPGLLVLEAGARFTTWRGEPVFPLRSLDAGKHIPTVAAPAAMHTRLIRALAEHPDPVPPNDPRSERQAGRQTGRQTGSRTGRRTGHQNDRSSRR